MRKVKRSEVVPTAEYEQIRAGFRESVLTQKAQRRIHVGQYLTFLFENHDTVLYQVQEMIRVEGITGEADILHEIETYNEVLGDRGELGATLLVEIDDPEERDRLLHKWTNLPNTLYIETTSGERIPARFDPRQVGDARISSVHYLKFAVGDRVVRRLGSSHPDIDAETELTPEQVATLSADLIG